MYMVKVRRSFAAAHRLPEYQGGCEALHGHNWHVEAMVSSASLDRFGMALDFRVLRGWVDEVLDELDHSYLNEHPAFVEVCPSSENVARFIFESLERRVDQEGIAVQEVGVWESDSCCAIYRRD